jgi:hypothetical protein
MKKLFHILFRFLFGIALIGIGLRIITDVTSNINYVNQTIDQIQHKLLKKDFKITNLKQHSTNIVYAEAFLFFASGLFTFFGFGFAKLLAFFAILIELALVHNVYFYRDPTNMIIASGFLAAFGGVLNI